MPFSRRTRTAASMSPFVSWSARFESIIGAPVMSRSSLTRVAEISAIGAHLLLNGFALLGHGLALLRDGLLAGGHLLVVALWDRRRLRRDFFRRGRAELAGRHLLLTRVDPVGDRAHDQVAGADRVVVAGDDIVGLVGIAVRVDERDDRQSEPACLAHGQLLLAEVDNEEGVRLTLHVGDAAEVLVELLELTLHGDPLLGGEELELP